MKKYYKNEKLKKYANEEEELYSELEAKNSTSNLVDLFRDRKAYGIEVFPGKEKKINFWEENYLYGKVNMVRDPVYLNEYNLLQLKAKDTIFALNFVVDAFEDFKTSMKVLLATTGNSIFNKESSSFYDFRPVKAWQPLTKLYANYLKNMSTAFLSTFLTPAREKRIVDFESFMELYIDSLDTVTKHLPLSIHAFVKSRFCPVNVSGLVIEISEQAKDDDSKKMIMLADKNYSLFVNQARKFGFLIDKNCPYRLVADIFSPVTREYMAKRGIPYDSNSVFELFFNKTNELEVSSLSAYLAEQYNNYVIFKPKLITYISKNGKSCKKIITRRPLMCFDKEGFVKKNSAYAKKYGDLFWIRFYFHLRTKEEKLEYSKYIVDTKLKKIYDYYRVHGLHMSIDKINRDILRQRED